jgi:ribonuclease HI
MQWDAQSIIYTDGSCIEKENGTHALGAGVCRPNCVADTAHVLPYGVGPTNTINRAELCAIYHAVNQTCRFNRNETIATDSLCSLQMIKCGLRRPHTHCDMQSTVALSEESLDVSNNELAEHALLIL